MSLLSGFTGHIHMYKPDSEHAKNTLNRLNRIAENHVEACFHGSVPERIWIGGILGGRKPSTYAQSPLLWNKYFDLLGTPGLFIPLDVSTHNQVIRILEVASSFDSFIDVTITDPYKKVVYELIDTHDLPVTKESAVNKTGIINHLIFDPHTPRITAMNTDGIAMVESLKKRTTLSGKTVLLIGSGATSTSISFELLRSNVHIQLTDAVETQSESLFSRLSSHSNEQDRITLLKIEDLPFALTEADIVVSTVPGGLPINAFEEAELRPGVLLAESTYGEKTQVEKFCRERGLAYVGGGEMLFRQFLKAADIVHTIMGAAAEDHSAAIRSMSTRHVSSGGGNSLSIEEKRESNSSFPEKRALFPSGHE